MKLNAAILSLFFSAVLVNAVETPDGTCGPANSGYTCGKTSLKCCSQYGYCGDSDLHCATSENCQPDYGECRASTASRCGKAFNGAKCASTQCCSEGGYCGSAEDFCYAPGCQQGYGKCDADAMPSGSYTSTISRPKVGKVLYGGAGIYDCVNPGEIALTFDDGPDEYTSGMVDLLNSYNAKATFFITGINNGKGAIDTTPAWAAVIKKMDSTGHQLASHTWSHADLDSLTSTQIKTEMHKLEMALRNIVGKFPTYMRPPYSKCQSAACMSTMAERGYHIVYFDLDTDDYNNDTPETIINAKRNFYYALKPKNPSTDAFLAIAHDIHQQTAQNLTQYMLDYSVEFGYKPVTLGKCLGDPVANWYRKA